jgi:dipeptidyl aminopeptidase/acylaminoacyl peptidase
MQIWYISINAPENPKQITNYPIDISNLKWSPNGEFFAFSANVYVDCKTLQCTADRDKESSDPNTGHIYESLYVRHWSTWETPHKYSHIFVQFMQDLVPSNDPVDVLKGIKMASPVPPFGGAEQFSISPQSNEIAFTAEVIEKEMAWKTQWKTYSVPVEKDACHILTWIAPEIQARTQNPLYNPNSTLIAFLAMKRPFIESDQLNIHLYDRSSKQHTCLTCKWDRSVIDYTWSKDGRYIFATATDIGHDRMFLIDVTTGVVTRLSDDGHVGGISVTGNTIIVSKDSMATPSDLWRYDFDPVKKSISSHQSLTNTNEKLMSQFKLNVPLSYTFASVNDTYVQAFILKPIDFDPDKKYPVAFLIHGGPESAWKATWSYRWNPQLFAQRGYVVIMVNPRGSVGHGQLFTDLVRNDWGGAPYQDLIKGLSSILAQYPWADQKRMCALGASYGGYMINWLQGRPYHPFKCFVNHDGAFDTVSKYYSTDELFFAEAENCPMDQRGCTPYTYPQGYEQFNPRNYVQNWKTPMLVIQGGRDYRVPESQALSAFTALQRKGIKSKLLYFPLENHWTNKPENGVLWYKTVLDWIDEFTAP